jgi:Pentapeptide repeats (8 copies)
LDPNLVSLLSENVGDLTRNRKPPSPDGSGRSHAWNAWRDENPNIHPDLREANLSAAKLSRADLRPADLREANLSGADLSGADLSGANLSFADLGGANLSEASLKKADLGFAYLNAANLNAADLSEANLSAAKLIGANLSRADLIKANLSGTDLSRACLLWATLVDTDFTCADLTGCHIHGVSAWGGLLPFEGLGNSIRHCPRHATFCTEFCTIVIVGHYQTLHRMRSRSVATALCSYRGPTFSTSANANSLAAPTTAASSKRPNRPGLV